MKNINEYKRRFNVLMESTMGDVKPLLNESEVDMSSLSKEEQIKAGNIMTEVVDIFEQLQRFENTTDCREVFGTVCKKKSYSYYCKSVVEVQKLFNMIIRFKNNHKDLIDSSIPLLVNVGLLWYKNEGGKNEMVLSTPKEDIINFIRTFIAKELPNKTITVDGKYGPETDEIMCFLYGLEGVFQAITDDI